MNHRRHERVPSRLRCWCESDNVTFYARVGNLSEGGLFLRTSTPLSTGARTRLRLGPEVEASATVMWAQSDSPSGDSGMGLRFDPLDTHMLDALRMLIAHEARSEPLDT